MPKRASTRHEDVGSTPHDTVRRLREPSSRSSWTLEASRAAKPPGMGRNPARPHPGPRLEAAEADRADNPSHLSERLGEPKRSSEMTSGTALVARRSQMDGRPAEVAAASCILLRGGDCRGHTTRRARPTCYETPPLPRAHATRLAASGLLSVSACAVPVSTVKQLERLQAAGSPPHRQVGAASTCLRRLPLRKQREDIRNTSTNLATIIANDAARQARAP